MAYREPGVYVEIINARPNTGFAPTLCPVIIGEGPAFFDLEDKALVRHATNEYDVLPSTTVTAITEVYTLSAGTKTVLAGDLWDLTSPNKITWLKDGGSYLPGVPAAGATFYVSYEARPEALQYEATYVTDFEALELAYGGQLMKVASGGEAATVNPVALGAYLALESGAAGIYVIQVEPASKDTYAVTIATDIVGAIEKATAIEDAYFMVPMTTDQTACGLVITHCDTMSATEERHERVVFSNLGLHSVGDESFGTLALVVADCITKISSYSNKRVRIPLINNVTKTLSDGIVHTLNASYFNAALAGLAATIPVERSLTRQVLRNFISMQDFTSLRRVQKNALAEEGFMVIEQPGGISTPLIIRHGVTTKMDNIADREHSIVTLADYVAKMTRDYLEGYIGVENIDKFLLTKVNGSLTALRNWLIRNRKAIDYLIKSLAQDEDNPDTLLITISYRPPYPCNYIDIDLLIE